MSATEYPFDDVFAHIAGQSGGIKPLLDHFFDFLHRKTDFYIQFDEPTKAVGASDQKYTMGFPKGIAERIVLQSFRKFPMKDYKITSDSSEVATSGNSRNISSTTSKQLSPSKSPSNVAAALDNIPSTGSTPSENVSTPPPRAPTVDNATTIPLSVVSSTPAVMYSDKGKQIPIGNGGVASNYYWTQTVKDLTIYIDVPHAIVASADSSGGLKGKHVKCNIGPRQLYVAILGEVLIDGEMEDIVKTEDSMWTLSKSSSSRGTSEVHGVAVQQIVITLDKTRHTWWKHVIEGDPEIDTNKVDSTQNISEYDESTQATIRKIMWEQQQKRLGKKSDGETSLSSSSEDPMQQLLQKASTLPGSPL